VDPQGGEKFTSQKRWEKKFQLFSPQLGGNDFRGWGGGGLSQKKLVKEGQATKYTTARSFPEGVRGKLEKGGEKGKMSKDSLGSLKKEGDRYALD